MPHAEPSPEAAEGLVALPRETPTPLHGLAATRQLEAHALAAAEPMALMLRAGRGAARLALAVAPHARRVWVGCGPGHNGGDGLTAAAALAAGPREVIATLDADPERLPPDTRRALEMALAAGVRVASEPPALGALDLAVDAWLGIGASRSPEGALAERVATFNESRAVRLALDVPSGLDAGTGRRFGPAACRAHHTLTFLTAKPGLFTAEGRDHAGQVWLDDLGVADIAPPDAWLGPGRSLCDTHPAAPRAHGAHKGRFGDVLVVGGAAGMVGAALLAARAAHAAGAGRVLLSPLDPSFGSRDLAATPALMWRPLPEPGDANAWHDAVVALGCGGGHAIGAVLPHALAHAVAAVLDADALNVIAGDPSLQRQLAGRGPRGRLTVLTPHPLEAARLLGANTAQVQADRLAAAQALADRFRATVVLKGSGSIVAEAGTTPWMNPTGSGALATGGTGDVLAGWLAGRWAAQGEGRCEPNCLAAVVREAVRLHGLAGEGFGAGPARADALVEAMAAAWTSRPARG